MDKGATCKEILQVQNEGNVRKTHFANADRPTALYGLDMILAVGYRVNSQHGIAFRRRGNWTKGRWAVFMAIFQTQIERKNG